MSVRQWLLLLVVLLFSELFTFAEGSTTTGSTSSSDSSTGSNSASTIDGTTGTVDGTATISVASSTATILPDESGFSWPEPYDTTVNNNFSTVSCQSLFEDMSNGQVDVISTCHPLSLLLSSSTGFFDAERNTTVLAGIMDDICAVDNSTCTENMASLLDELDSRCEKELSNKNSFVEGARGDLEAFSTMFEAGCAQDSGDNCLVLANKNESSDASLFYVGLGRIYSDQPSCSDCSKTLMEIFSKYSANSSLPVATAYPASYTTITSACGSDFAPSPSSDGSSSGASILSITTEAGMLWTVSGLFLYLTVFMNNM